MKTILKALVSLLAVVSAAAPRGSAQSANKPGLTVEVQAAGKTVPFYQVRNVSDKIITAYAVEFSSQASNSRTSSTWDALMLFDRPIAPKTFRTNRLSQVVARTVPDRAEIVAVVWEDGETFGPRQWIENIVNNRAKLARQYEHNISLLQRGIRENWTEAQFCQAWCGDGKVPNKPATSTLSGNSQAGADQKRYSAQMQKLLDRYVQRLDLLRSAKPKAIPPPTQIP